MIRGILLVLSICFYAPSLKGVPVASSYRIVGLSVCPFVCLCIIMSRLQTKCYI